MRAFTLCLPAIAMMLVVAPPAMAEGMALLRAEPRPSQVMSGSGVAFAPHFDRPLDHQKSSFMLQDLDGAARTVPVRLGAQPSVLYASLGRLPTGAYALNWSACSSSGEILEGTLPFTVGPGAGNGQGACAAGWTGLPVAVYAAAGRAAVAVLSWDALAGQGR